jgi:CHAT domain-containing protein
MVIICPASLIAQAAPMRHLTQSNREEHVYMMTGRQCPQLIRLSLKCLFALAVSHSLLIPALSHPLLRLTAETAHSQIQSRLLPDAKVEREIRSGEVHTYSLALTAGEFVRLIAEGRARDLVLSLQEAGGKTVVEVDSPSTFSNHLRLSFVSAQAGDYQLTVRSRKNVAPGSYQLKAAEWRRGEVKDQDTVAAEKLLAEGQILYWRGTAESRLQAIRKYEESLALWRAASDIQGEAEALSRLSEIAHQVSDNRKALEQGEQALRLWRLAGDRSGEAGTLNIIGLARWGVNEYQKALEDFDKALSLRRAMGNRRGEASILQSIGIIYSTLGESQMALEHYGQAISLWRETGDSAGEASTLTNLGVVYTALGEYQKALTCYDRALPLRRAAGNRRGEGYTLNNIGDVYNAVGEYPRALEYYEQALLSSRAAGDRWAQANTLNHMGNVYSALGDYQKAMENYNQTLALHRDISERRGEANSLSDIGTLWQKLGEYRKAADYHEQALSIRRAIGDRSGEVSSLNNLGLVSSALDDSQKALDFYSQAFTLSRAMESPFTAAQALHGIARVERNRGNLTAALTQIQLALEIIESLRTKLSAQDLRATFHASVRELYDLQIDLLSRLDEQQPEAGYAAAAFVVSERSRARSLLETLAEARADIRQGVAPELLERERSLQQKINANALRLTRLLGGKHSAEQASADQKELDSLLIEYQQVQTQIRTASPRYAALTQPQPLTVKEFQQQILDQDTLLLEYSLGEERSFLWAVSPTSITSFVLPKRAKVEAAARRVYGLLTAHNQRTRDETPAQYRARLAKAEVGYPQAAADLSRMLLAPVASQLGTKRLLIVSEGALQYVPFAALPIPEGGRWGGGEVRSQGAKGRAGIRLSPLRPSTPTPLLPTSRPLIVDHEIINLPSASVLALLRRELTSRKPAPKALAVLADPVFGNEDPRVAAEGATPARSSAGAVNHPEFDSDIKRSLRDAGLNNFVRLRFSRQEAEAISALLPERDRLKALDFTASRATAQSQELGQYRMLHFATHGLLNSLHPELSGLVFSLVDERGQAQDGFLRFHEIYNLKLKADLVVLSACQTALGKEVRGEGLIGLTRGFMYAGAPRVVASLWRVDDRATAELMKRFYRGMLKDGLRPAAALRTAQVSMLTDKRWQAPRYWAAFTIQGEWR